MDRGQHIMGSGFNIPWVEESEYHGKRFDITWVGGQNAMDRGIDI